MTTIIFYHKDGCHLCDETRAGLRGLALELDLDVRECDITGDADLFARYRYAIPVIETEAGRIFRAPINMSDLREVLHGTKR